MQPNNEWILASEAWDRFAKHHPELALKGGFWQFHNFLRLHRAELVSHDAIRKARGRWWIAHSDRFDPVAFDCATGGLHLQGS